MTGLRVFRVCQQRGSTGRWGTLVNGRAVSCEPVNTAWTRSSAGLATSAVPEERASCGRASVSSGQVGRRRARLTAMAPVLSPGVLQGRRYSNPVATTPAHTEGALSCSNIAPELSTQRSEWAQVEEACPRQLMSHVLKIVRSHRALAPLCVQSAILLWQIRPSHSGIVSRFRIPRD